MRINPSTKNSFLNKILNLIKDPDGRIKNPLSNYLQTIIRKIKNVFYPSTNNKSFKKEFNKKKTPIKAYSQKNKPRQINKKIKKELISNLLDNHSKQPVHKKSTTPVAVPKRIKSPKTKQTLSKKEEALITKR